MSLRDWPILRRLSPDFFATIRMAFVFGQAGDEALLITSDDKVHGVGTNSTRCLGVVDGAAHPLPAEVVDLTNKGVKGLACGGTSSSKSGIFVVAFTHTEGIYRWGYVPHRSSSISITRPQKIISSSDLKVVTVACGNSHCVILSEDGKVFSWGNNEDGQLGHLENTTYDSYNGDRGSLIPCQVKGIIEEKIVIEISCGGKFSVVLLDTGRVVTWGCNQYGQLGIDSKTSHSVVPVEVSALNELGIKKLACGSAHVLAVSETNVVYGWGSNSFSQLGFSNPSDGTVTYFRAPKNLEDCFLQLRITDVGASYACDLSVAQCESEEVFVFGKISSGVVLCKPTNSQCESIDQVFAYFASPNMMRKPMRHILQAKRRTTMLRTMESEFGKLDTSDLTIVVGEKEIPVHQTILKLRSEYFKTMLTRWLTEGEKVITIKEKKFAVINTYLKYLYTDELEVDLDLAMESLLLADEYGDDNFKSLCEKSIKRDIKPEKVAEIFLLTRKIKVSEDFNQFCLDFIFDHDAEVVNTPGFQKWDMDTLKVVFLEFVKKRRK